MYKLRNINRWDKLYRDRQDNWTALGATEFQEKILAKFIGKNDSVLELGCGVGNEARNISKLCKNYVGWDCSETAIKQAKANKQPNEQFECLNAFTELEKEGGEYDVIYEKGLFHNCLGNEERAELAELIARNLKEQGYWIGVSGAADDLQGLSHGKVFLTDIVKNVEPYFEIQEMHRTNYGKTKMKDFAAWLVVLKRR